VVTWAKFSSLIGYCGWTYTSLLLTTTTTTTAAAIAATGGVN